MGVVTQDLWRPPVLGTPWEAREQEPRAAARVWSSACMTVSRQSEEDPRGLRGNRQLTCLSDNRVWFLADQALAGQVALEGGAWEAGEGSVAPQPRPSSLPNLEVTSASPQSCLPSWRKWKHH